MALSLAVLLAGCQGPATRSAVRHGPVLPESTPAPVPAPLIVELPQPEAPVAVVLSADTAPYRSVADALGDGQWRRFVLTADNGPEVLAALRASGARRAIAIGQQALALLADEPFDLAYCQVFDAPPELRAGRRGVAALPDWGAQLDAWRRLQPDLGAIGVITGTAHGGIAAELESAAAPRAITIHHAVARSDRELLFLFRRMVPELDGFLLYPDTSVLSPRAIRELLAYAAKHDVRVLTYNRPIFELGAALLATVDPAEVAREVVLALDAGGTGETPLERVRLQRAGASGGSGQ